MKAESIKEVFNYRGNERTFVQSNPITFPGVNCTRRILHSPSGPKHEHGRSLSSIAHPKIERRRRMDGKNEEDEDEDDECEEDKDEDEVG